MYKITNKIKIILGIIIIILFLLVGYYICVNNDNSEVLSYNEELDTKTEEDTEEKIVEEKNKSTIIVHIAGCVVNAGIVELQENSRISDAIEKAGGLTEEADISKINLAYLLEDGMKIYIPSHNEIEEEKNMESNSNFSEEYITRDSGVVNTDMSTDLGKNTSEKKNQKININSATQEELENLPGIGDATALKIINYRNENGKFKSIEDIKNVKGIGDSKFEKIKDLISVK